MLLKSIRICSLRRLSWGQVPDTYLYYIAFSFLKESSFLRREERSKEALPLPRPSPKGRMQSQDLGKPQIPPTFLAGRDFGLYCFLSQGQVPVIL